LIDPGGRAGRRPNEHQEQQGHRHQRAEFAVALLPPIAGLTGEAFQQPQVLATGFHTAMLITAGLAAAGGLLAFATISNDVLAEQPPAAHPVSRAVAGAPYTLERNARGSGRAPGPA
jgi:hypothetical protein